MPEYVKYITSTYSYTFTHLIAETGGWIGLLVGVSVLDIYDFILQKSGITARVLLDMD